jgi:hypothetical protein
MDILEKKENLHALKSKPHLIYLNADMGSVFESQVAQYLISLAKKDVFSSITLVCGFKSLTDQERARKALNATTIQLHFFKAYPNYPLFNIAQQNAIHNELKTINGEKNTHIHVRGELLASLSLKPIEKIFGTIDSVVVDVRGAGYEELSLYHQAASWKIALKKWNYKLAFKRLRNFHKISAVSPALKEYLIKNAKISASKIHVIHCLAGEKFGFDEESRRRIRAALQVDDSKKILVFSSGGNAAWQKADELKRLISDKYIILNLSREHYQEKGIINRFIPYNEVSDYLNAADVAVIFRDNNVVNQVACPVKFCEYVCCGLPVISNKAVDEIYNYIQKNDQGLLIENPDEIHTSDLNSLFELNRYEKSVAARSIYGENAIVRLYLNLYFAN